MAALGNESKQPLGPQLMEPMGTTRQGVVLGHHCPREQVHGAPHKELTPPCPGAITGWGAVDANRLERGYCFSIPSQVLQRGCPLSPLNGPGWPVKQAPRRTREPWQWLAHSSWLSPALPSRGVIMPTPMGLRAHPSGPSSPSGGGRGTVGLISQTRRPAWVN